ncbi:Zn(II)2Cys6 transcription factor [Aspergillus undulatus]|uniref:Zn(II)2Cys6 transcription factor n=1 Tax=Aspergillus undulatus TaxID=1810928 RepID=UPI003CCE36CE
MLSRRVCDSCHSRKVRCDRNDPCGNCMDQNTACTRSRGMRRLPKRDLSAYRRRGRAITAADHQRGPTPPVSQPPQYQSQAQSQSQATSSDTGLNLPGQIRNAESFGMSEDQRLMLFGRLDMDMNMNLNINMNINFDLQSWMSIVPLTETQMINRKQPDHTLDLTWTRRRALESALSVAGRILGSLEQTASAADEGQRYIPSAELLLWMLKDIGSDKFGSFISDYFRHVGKENLKAMGLAILSNTATPPDDILYTICVNSVAFKFLNATLGTGADDDDLAQRLCQSALLYRETAKATLKQIPLVTKPSLTLLQALLCGIFLHQGSGDTNACRELAKTACRVAMDIGLHPGAANMESLTEAEYYCFMWCFMLDRNYAWKFGGPRILHLEPDAVIGPPPTHVTVSKLILIYLDLAKVQDVMIPFLNDPTKAGRENAFHFPNGVGIRLLQKMEGIRRDINQIKPPSPSWIGLDPASEIATLDFAYHCILTNLLHIRQIVLGQHQNNNTGNSDRNMHNQTTTPVETYLDSARRGLGALLTLCASSDRQKTVAYLHWTLLYYPITACIALFCNAIATSHAGDFAILSAVSQCLAQSGSLSPPIAAMQSLLDEFVALSRGFFFGMVTGGESRSDRHVYSQDSGSARVTNINMCLGNEDANPSESAEANANADALGLIPLSSSAADFTPMSAPLGTTTSAQDALSFPLPALIGSGLDFAHAQGFGLGSGQGQQEVEGDEGAFSLVFEDFLSY